MIRPVSRSLIQPEIIDPDLIRIAHCCVPSLESIGSLSAEKGADAADWMTDIFLKSILPAIRDAYLLASTGGLREIAQMDVAMSETITTAMSEKLAGLGRAILLEQIPPRGERLLARFAEKVRSNETPGHFPIVFAMRAVAFHIPLRQAIAAYLYLESRGACPEDSAPQWSRTCMENAHFANALLAVPRAA